MTVKYYIFILVIIAIGLHSCADSDLSGYWITTQIISYSKADAILVTDSVYGEYHRLIPNENALFIDTSAIKDLYKFEDDSITITNFNETIYRGYYTYKYAYELKNDSLSLSSDRDSFSFKIEKQDNETLEISYSTKNYKQIHTDKKIVLVPLKKYGQAFEKERLIEELTDNSYIEDSEHGSIEFLPPEWLHMGRIVYNDLSSKYAKYDDWFLEVFEEELFLGLGDKLYQVTDLSESGIEVLSYERNIHDKLIRKVRPQNGGHHTSLLSGKWLRTNIPADEKNKSRNPLDDEKPHIEIAQFQDDELIIFGEQFSDTSSWRLNKAKEKIILESDYNGTFGRFWKIVNLTDRVLECERVLPNSFDNTVERLKFTKIE